MNNLKKGFTLIELILYVALVSVFVTAAIMFSWDVIYGREKSFNQQIVQQSARIALNRISYEIGRAKNVQSIQPGQIVLDLGTTTTIIALSGNVVQVSPEANGPHNLTSNQVAVNNLTFTDLTSSGNDSKNVKVVMDIVQAEPAATGQQTAQTHIEQTLELNSQFNQSRQLLANYTLVNLVGGVSLEGITFENSSAASDLVIDQLEISWSGTSGGENVTEIQIGGGSIEWTGLTGSGSVIDIADFTLSQSDGVVSFDYMAFNSDITNASLNIDYVLGDGSRVRTQLDLISLTTPTPVPSVTPTPAPTLTPTPTPTPQPNSCSSLCVSNGYSSGICRRNALDCSRGNETYLPSGDLYCTGGPNADTCCCSP